MYFACTVFELYSLLTNIELNILNGDLFNILWVRLFILFLLLTLRGCHYLPLLFKNQCYIYSRQSGFLNNICNTIIATYRVVLLAVCVNFFEGSYKNASDNTV